MLKFIAGTPETPKTGKVIASGKKVDLDKLYWAVAKHESGKCSTPWHKKTNNCVSIMTWSTGKRMLKQFPSIESNKEAFKKLWSSHYGGGMPTLALAKRYSGNDKAVAWLNNVLYFYAN